MVRSGKWLVVVRKRTYKANHVRGAAAREIGEAVFGWHRNPVYELDVRCKKRETRCSRSTGSTQKQKPAITCVIAGFFDAA